MVLASRSPAALACVAALALLAVPARADIPPPDDSPDAHCTPDQQCPSGVYCPYAFRPGQPDGEWKDVGADCRRDVGSRGLGRRCRNGGNYGGQELFCPPGEKGTWSPGQVEELPPPEPPAPPIPPPTPPVSAPGPAAAAGEPVKAGMCDLGGGSGPAGLLVLAAAWGLRRRRVRRASRSG